jgi:hypothetical protein
MVIEHSVVIERPLDEVWSIFDDPARQVEWQKDLVQYEHLSGRGNGKGSVSRLTFERDGGQTVLTATVEERTPPKRFVAVYEGMQLPFKLTSTFTALSDESSEWHAEIEVRLNLLQKALTPVLKGAMSELAQRNGDGFKRYVESI